MFASLRTAVARNTRSFSSHAEAARKLAALGVKLPERSASTAAAEARKDSVLRSAADPVKKSVFAVLQAAKNAGVSLNDAEAFNKWLSTDVEAEAAVQKLMFPDSFVEYAKDPVRVAVTGAAGNIGYAALFRIASGQMLGPDQPVILHLLEQGPGFKALDGVEMELQDCAFPLLAGVVKADDPNKGFENVDYALLIGAKPRGPGMERADVLKDNAAIFQIQGKALNAVANKNVKVGVVGNPANTNALIAARNAPDLNPANFTAMTRLDENRAVAQVAEKANVKTTDISRVTIWGNHSATQYPDLSHALIGGKWAKDIINDEKWIQGPFLSSVQQRGATVINARGASSAASAANAIIEHMHDWAVGSKGEWASMAVLSTGEYGITEGLYSSFPTVSSGGSYEIVGNVPIDPFSAQKIELSHKELLAERDTVKSLLP